MNIFMLSNAKVPNNTRILEYALAEIIDSFVREKVKNVLVITYAVVRMSAQSRVDDVKNSFADLDLNIKGIEEFDDPVEAVYQADVIMVSGGNTWQLNKMLHDNGLIEPIRDVVLNHNVTYVGWSAGSLICCPTICTTNDMCPVSAAVTSALGFVPFQINAHYIDSRLHGHMGETRDERIAEYCILNPHKTVLGIAEGTWLHLDDDGLHYHAPQQHAVACFKFGEEKQWIVYDEDMNRFMQFRQ
ncbi:dipeptidase PepE [Pasteurellaceae bacterium 20609_3]|uniref:dipeptidase PepE n=1 Tax=Spirabiliibacterium mucosae TaxID=28156 RepID=UPI001AAD4BD4|nr:dipeptidase PepE [Spirabiliibacterium mucosae]MBE2898903.1 dipeptidase PepE [Spirabiliibacterium mucosae]